MLIMELATNFYKIAGSLGREITPHRVARAGIAFVAVGLFYMAASTVCGVFASGGLDWQKAVERAEVGYWTDEVNKKMADSKYLQFGEGYNPKLKVIGQAGFSSVNIRAVPATIYPTGNQVDIIGTMAQGTEITGSITIWGNAPQSPNPAQWVAGDCSKSFSSARWSVGVNQQNLEGRACFVLKDLTAPSN